ncbi:MAG TPA: ATP-binding protein [Acidobacteriota bacterium]|nr:ATP-binding protein [Acidobacteriota bacterium]
MRLVLCGVVSFTWLTTLAAPPEPPTPSAEPPPLSDLAALGRPFFRTYTDRDGLPQNTIQALAVDSRGYLWIGTQDGAACYNGRQWTTVRLPKEAASNFIQHICPAPDNRIWFTTDKDDVCCLNQQDGTWQYFSVAPPQSTTSTISAARVLPILPQNQRTLVVATTNGEVLVFEQGQWHPLESIPKQTGDWVTAFGEATTPDGKPQIWIGTRNRRLYQNSGSEWIWGGLPQSSSRVPILNISALVDQKGVTQLWVTIGRTIWHLDGGWTPIELPRSLFGNQLIHIVTSLVTTDAQGQTILWVGTNAGLLRYHTGQWTLFDIRKGLPHNFVYQLLEIKSGNSMPILFIGTLGGLSRLVEGKWLAIDSQAGLPNPFVLSILESVQPDGPPSFWFGSFGGGRGGSLSKFENGEWTSFENHAVIPNNVGWALSEITAADGNKKIWYGSNAGLFEMDGQEWHKIPTQLNPATGGVMSLSPVLNEPGQPEEVWVGLSNGLLHFYNGATTTYTTESGLPSNTVTQLLITTSQNGQKVVWVGTTAGLARFENQQWTVYTRQNGLVYDHILSLCESRPDASSHFLWIGTRGGVSRLDLSASPPLWKNFSETTIPALPNDTVYQIREDSHHRMYFSTNRGILRLTAQSPSLQDYTVTSFSLEDGLPSNECNRGASLVDHQGRLWFGTIAGAVVFDPTKEILDTSPKPLFLERILVGGQPVTSQAIRSLRYTENNLSFEYALLSFFREGDTRFQTQLVGLEASPTPWTADFKKEYLNLGEGQYCFQVWGKDYAGNVTGPVAIQFEIHPAPWRSWPAYVVYVLAGTGAIFALFRYRLRVLQHRTQELEAKVAERTAQVVAQKNELAEANLKLRELDQIKVNFTAMLVHDLKSPLSVVKATLELFEIEESIQHSTLMPLVTASERSIDKILALINEVLEVFRSETQGITLRKSFIDTEKLLRECAEEARVAAVPHNISVTYRIEPNLPSVFADPEKLERVFSNLFSNAIKFTQDGGSITLESRTVQGQGVETGITKLLITITDTGEGIPAEDLPYLFDPYHQAQSRKAKLGIGLGLAIVKRIIAAHGGNISVRSQPGVGTSFTIMLPIMTSSDRLQKVEIEE